MKIILLMGILFLSCSAPMGRTPVGIESDLDGYSRKPGSGTRYAALIHKTVQESFGLTNSALIVGLALHESGLTHCMGDIEVDARGMKCPATSSVVRSDYCASIYGSDNDKIFLGQSDPTCAQAGLGLFQIDRGTQTATITKNPEIADPKKMAELAMKEWIIGRALDGYNSSVKNWKNPGSRDQWVRFLNSIVIPKTTVSAKELEANYNNFYIFLDFLASRYWGRSCTVGSAGCSDKIDGMMAYASGIIRANNDYLGGGVVEEILAEDIDPTQGTVEETPVPEGPGSTPTGGTTTPPTSTPGQQCYDYKDNYLSLPLNIASCNQELVNFVNNSGKQEAIRKLMIATCFSRPNMGNAVPSAGADAPGGCNCLGWVVQQFNSYCSGSTPHINFNCVETFYPTFKNQYCAP